MLPTLISREYPLNLKNLVFTLPEYHLTRKELCLALKASHPALKDSTLKPG